MCAWVHSDPGAEGCILIMCFSTNHTVKRLILEKDKGIPLCHIFPCLKIGGFMGGAGNRGQLWPSQMLYGNSALPSGSPLMGPPPLLPCPTAAVCLNADLLKSTTYSPSHLPPSLPHIHTSTQQSPTLLTVRWVNAWAGRMELFLQPRLCAARSAALRGQKRRLCLHGKMNC